MLVPRMIADPSRGHTPRSSVPSHAAADALDMISVGLRAGCSPVLVAGARGIGKTLLLGVLAEREQQAFERVRYTELPQSPDALPGHLLQVLYGVASPRRTDAAELALQETLVSEWPRRSLVLVDHLERADAACIAQLAELARVTKPALTMVAAGAELEDQRSLANLLEAGFSVFLPESLAEGLAGRDFPQALAFEAPPVVAAPRATRLVPELAHAIVRAAAPRVRSTSLKWRAAGFDLARSVADAALRARAEFAASSARSRELVTRRAKAVRTRARGAIARGVDAGREIRSALAHVAGACASLAAPLLVAGLLAANAPERAEPIAVAAAPPPREIERPAVSAAPLVFVQVNARPWARVWINGVDLGPTPLRKALPQGVHGLEAQFPDGRRIKRLIDVTPDRRFFALR